MHEGIFKFDTCNQSMSRILLVYYFKIYCLKVNFQWH